MGIGYEDGDGDVVRQRFESPVVPSDFEVRMELVAEIAFEGVVVLEIKIEVSMSAGGMKGVPKSKFVKF